MNNKIENTLFQCRAINKEFGNVRANNDISINVRSGIVEMFGSKERKKENKIDNKSDSASKVVIQGETKAEELPI